MDSRRKLLGLLAVRQDIPEIIMHDVGAERLLMNSAPGGRSPGPGVIPPVAASWHRCRHPRECCRGPCGL